MYLSREGDCDIKIHGEVSKDGLEVEGCSEKSSQ